MTIVFMQFFKMGAGQAVAKILREVPLPSEDAGKFQEFARPALVGNRGNKRAPEWPDAIRLVDEDGTEINRWTIFDEQLAEQRDRQAAIQEAREARRSQQAQQ